MNEVNPYASPKHDDREPSKEPEISSARLPHDILLSGSMSVHDVLRTQLLILKHRWFYAALTLGIYVAFVIVLGLFTPGDRIFGNTFMVLGLVIMPAILPFTLLMVFLRLQRDAKHKAGIFAVTETRLSNEGIHTNIQQAEGRASLDHVFAFPLFAPCDSAILEGFERPSDRGPFEARPRRRLGGAASLFERSLWSRAKFALIVTPEELWPMAPISVVGQNLVARRNRASMLVRSGRLGNGSAVHSPNGPAKALTTNRAPTANRHRQRTCPRLRLASKVRLK